MFFPIGDVNVTRGVKPLLTPILIITNIAVFIWMLGMPPEEQVNFVYARGAIPTEILRGHSLLSLITSLFIHGGWMHLIGNMLFLWVFADNIESTIGYSRFIFFYFLGGIVATLTHIFFNPLSHNPCVGASGSIAACLGAYMIMFPGSKIKVLFLLFLRSFYVPAFLFLGIWIIQQTLAGIGSLSAVVSETGGVAYWAHIGGFVFGLLSGIYFYAEVKNKQ